MSRQAPISHNDYSPEALLQRAQQLHQAGQLQQAAGQYRKYLRLQPGDAETWHLLTGLYYHLGKHDAALSALEKAIAADPDNPDYLNDLGGLQLALKNYPAARDCFQQVLAMAPDYQGAQYNLAHVLLQQDKLAEAIALLQDLVTRHPDYAEAHYNLGRALHAQGQQQAAIDALKRVLQLQPGFVTAQLQLARYCKDLHYLVEAMQHYREALAQFPDNAEAALGLADCLNREGRTQEAIETLEQFLQRAPDVSEVHSTLGQILLEQGDIERAQAGFLKALDLKPENTHAVYGLAAARRFNADDQPVIERVTGLLKRFKPGDTAATGIHFALGKIHDDCGDYDLAFDHYRRGNQMKHKPDRYNRQLQERLVQNNIDIFTRETIEQLQAVGDPNELPVFIVGMPRSGTTLTEQILSSHPQAHGAGELVYFSSIVRMLPSLLNSDQPWPSCVTELDAETAGQITQNYLDLLRRHSADADRISDKMPGNFMLLGLIAGLFPRARLIHCRRDPMDVCLSIYFQHFAMDHPYSWDLSDLGHYYRQYRRITDHWRTVLPGRILELDYEAMVAEPEPNARRLIEYCGLEWDPACLEFYKTERQVRTASISQVRQPIYQRSKQRWRRYEQHLQPLKEALGDVLESAPEQ